MRNLELHYQDYMRDSQDSQLFGPDDRMQIEEDYTKSTQHFDSLIRSMEKGNICFPKNDTLAFDHLWLYMMGIYVYTYFTVCNCHSPFRTNGC